MRKRTYDRLDVSGASRLNRAGRTLGAVRKPMLIGSSMSVAD